MTRPRETASIRGRKASREVCFPFHNVVLSVKRRGRDCLPLIDKLPQEGRLTTQNFQATPAGGMLPGVFPMTLHNLNTHHIMKKIINAIVTIVLLLAVVFLGGEWPETATRSHIILCDGGAFLLIAACSLYLRRVGAFKREDE